MKNLTLNLEEEICIIDKYGLTPNELLVIRVLLILQDDRQEELFHNLLIALKHTDLSFRDILVQLQNKGIVLKSFKIPVQGTSFDPYSIPINKNFIKNLYRSSFEMGKELFEAYMARKRFGLLQVDGGNEEQKEIFDKQDEIFLVD